MSVRRGHSTPHCCTSEDGFATAVEMMYLLTFCIVAVLFLGYLGRLHAAGVEITNTAQSAGRAASQAAGPTAALDAARAAVDASPLPARCSDAPLVTLDWVPSPTGSWRGGAVTVRVECTVTQWSLAGVWAPGTRTFGASDTQPIDRYRR